MTTSSPILDAHTRKNQQLILRGLASVGQAFVATQLGVNESTVSRWKETDIERFAKMLAVLGLKVTPQAYRCYDESTLQAMLTLAKQRMNQLDDIGSLAWEDE